MCVGADTLSGGRQTERCEDHQPYFWSSLVQWDTTVRRMEGLKSLCVFMTPLAMYLCMDLRENPPHERVNTMKPYLRSFSTFSFFVTSFLLPHFAIVQC